MSVAGSRKSTVGVDHTGAPHKGAFVPLDHPNATKPHPGAAAGIKLASGMEAVTNVHADLGVAAKVKRAFTTAPAIHSGMMTTSKRGALTGNKHDAFGADHASAIDSLTGLAVVPDKDGSVANAHPLVAAPVAKGYPAPKLSPTMKRQTGAVARSLDDARPHDIRGQMLIDEAKS